jgi:hypothetical protein
MILKQPMNSKSLALLMWNEYTKGRKLAFFLSYYYIIEARM